MEYAYGVEEVASSPLEYIFSDSERLNAMNHPLSFSSSSSSSSRAQGSTSPEILRGELSKSEEQMENSDRQINKGPALSSGLRAVSDDATRRAASVDKFLTASSGGQYIRKRPDAPDLRRPRVDSTSWSEPESVDGLVLINSTRLRPAAKASINQEKFVNLYLHTYRSLFVRPDCTSAIIPLALHGNLQNNPFRSICWRVLLNVLPCSSIDWIGALESLRSTYFSLKEEYLSGGRLNDPNIDLNINNPLSQDEESPWNQHFLDSELRRVIEQDVNRTSPEIDFFQDSAIRDSLSNILFVFAKSHPNIAYKQGMHELLAPLYYVVYQDIMNHDKTSNMAKLSGEDEFKRVIPQDLFKHQYLDADVYALFEAVIDCVSDWYIQPRSSTPCKQVAAQPWSRPQDDPAANQLVKKLNHIQDSLLRRQDPELFSRLQKLEIYPQLYGIRWLRLLFGREFHFLDTLQLWDAIFADSGPPGLVDQITVSLLVSVRDLILEYDYTDAVSLLMKLPSNISVTFIIAFALHLKDPLRFPRPTGSVFECGNRRPEIFEHVPRRSPQPVQQSRNILGSRRREKKENGELSLKSVKTELKQIDKSFNIQHPRDLPDFTVVEINDLKVRRGEYDTCDSEELHVSPGRSDQASLANSLYCSKLELYKSLDTIRDLLRGEQFGHKTKILKEIDVMQQICDTLGGEEYTEPEPHPTPAPPPPPPQIPVRLKRNVSLAHDAAASLTHH